MDPEILRQQPDPAGLSLPMAALWHIHRDEWYTAHALVQTHEGDPACDRIHALLHRIEGDVANARWWYRQTGQAPHPHGVTAEWESLVSEL